MNRNSLNRLTIDSENLIIRKIYAFSNNNQPIQSNRILTVDNSSEGKWVNTLENISSYGVGMLPDVFSDIRGSAANLCNYLTDYLTNNASSFGYATNAMYDSLSNVLASNISTGSNLTTTYIADVSDSVTSLSNYMSANLLNARVLPFQLSDATGILRNSINAVSTYSINVNNNLSTLSSAFNTLSNNYSTFSNYATGNYVLCNNFQGLSTTFATANSYLMTQINNVSNYTTGTRDQYLLTSLDLSNYISTSSNALNTYINLVSTNVASSQGVNQAEFIDYQLELTSTYGVLPNIVAGLSTVVGNSSSGAASDISTLTGNFCNYSTIITPTINTLSTTTFTTINSLSTATGNNFSNLSTTTANNLSNLSTFAVANISTISQITHNHSTILSSLSNILSNVSTNVNNITSTGGGAVNNTQFTTLSNNVTTLSNNFTGVSNNYISTSNKLDAVSNNFTGVSNNYILTSNKVDIVSNNFTGVSNNYILTSNKVDTVSNNFSTTSNNFSTLSNNFSTTSNNLSTLSNNYSTTSNNFSTLSNNYRYYPRFFSSIGIFKTTPAYEVDVNGTVNSTALITSSLVNNIQYNPIIINNTGANASNITTNKTTSVFASHWSQIGAGGSDYSCVFPWDSDKLVITEKPATASFNNLYIYNEYNSNYIPKSRYIYNHVHLTNTPATLDASYLQTINNGVNYNGIYDGNGGVAISTINNVRGITEIIAIPHIGPTATAISTPTYFIYSKQIV